MKIYRFPDHYEVVDNDTLYYISYLLTSIRKVGKVDPRVWSPIGGSLVSNPMKPLLFACINLVKKCRDVARTTAVTSSCRIGSAARQK